MNRLISNGFAEITHEKPTGKRQFYLTHFGVQNVNKPGKVRLVFDAAAKTNGTSFNDLLLTGPDLLKNLLGVLMRFKQKRYAVKADLRDTLRRIGRHMDGRVTHHLLFNILIITLILNPL